MRGALESVATVLLLVGLSGLTSCSTPPKAQDDTPEEPPRLTGIVDSQRLRPIESNRPEKPRTAFVTPAPVTQRPARALASSGGSSSGGQTGGQGASGSSASQSGASGKQGAQGKSGQGEQSSGQSSSQSQGNQSGQSQSGQSSSQGTQGQSQNSSQSSNNSGSSQSSSQNSSQSSSASGQQSSSSQSSQSSGQSQGAQSGQSASSSSSSSSGASGQSSQGSQSQSAGQQGGQQGQQGQPGGQQGQQPTASSTAGVASPGGEAGFGGGDNSYGNDAWKQRPELTAGGTAGAVSAESVLEALRSGSGSGHGAGSGGGGSGGGQTGDPEEASASGANPVSTTEDEMPADGTDATAPAKDGSSSATGDPQSEAGEVSDAGDATTLEGGTDDDPDSDSAESASADDAQSEATDASDSSPRPRPKPEPEQKPSESFAGLSFPEREQASRPRPKPRPRPADFAPPPTPDDQEPVEPVVQQLRGTWKQVDADPTIGPDFAPSGAAVRVIGIDPDRRRMLSVTAWGSPPSLVLAGEVEAGFRASGRVSIRVRDDLEGGRYPALPTTLPAGLGSYGQPTEEALELRWSVADGKLTLGERTYAPCDPAELDALLADSGGNSSDPTPDAGGVVTSSLDAPEAGSTDFFGLKATGRWFCYIVDTSGSMGRGGKIDRLKEELAKSINGLPSDAKFYVLFFSSSTHTLQNKWLSASSSGSFTGRLGEVGPKGGTNPRDAINIALTQLDPKPDAIFFMTDGEIPGDCVGQIGKLNAASPKIRIHTVAFGGGAGGGALKTIADQNGGQFRHVP